jgi:hypothetical protein
MNKATALSVALFKAETDRSVHVFLNDISVASNLQFDFIEVSKLRSLHYEGREEQVSYARD